MPNLLRVRSSKLKVKYYLSVLGEERVSEIGGGRLRGLLYFKAKRLARRRGCGALKKMMTNVGLVTREGSTRSSVSDPAGI